MKLKNILGLAVCLVGTGIFTSCDDFFDLNPKDQLTTNTFWNTSEDVDAAVTAAYNWWVNNYVGSKFIFYEDSYSDIGFNYTNASNMRNMGRGSVSPTAAPNYWRQYETIRRCNFWRKYGQLGDIVMLIWQLGMGMLLLWILYQQRLTMLNCRVNRKQR